MSEITAPKLPPSRGELVADVVELGAELANAFFTLISTLPTLTVNARDTITRFARREQCLALGDSIAYGIPVPKWLDGLSPAGFDTGYRVTPCRGRVDLRPDVAVLRR